MPELHAQQVAFLICVGLFTALAAVTDYRTRRIPNKLTIPMFLLGLLYQVVFNGWSGAEGTVIGEAGLQSALLGFAIGFGPLFVLWMIGGGGGGDVKLMGALSVWLGFRLTLLVLIVSTVFVLLGTLAVMIWSVASRGAKKTKARFIATRKPNSMVAGQTRARETVQQRQQRRIMAYAVPVALATWVVVLWKIPQ